jgi:hypothetical protein
MSSTAWLLLVITLPAAAHAADVKATAAVSPATTEDLDAFDQSLEKFPDSQRITSQRQKQLGQEISSQAKALRDSMGMDQLSSQAAPPKHNQGDRSSGFSPRGLDARAMQEAISGKRSGHQDNPGKGDRGKPANGISRDNKGGNGH